MTKYDVVVVGAGPSGSTTAFHLAKAGARVLLIDRAKFPREKPCGGGVTVRAFREAPVDLTPVVEQRIRRVRFSFRLGDFFDQEYPETLVYMTQRHRLDAFLVEQAVAAGAVFEDGHQVRAIELDVDGATVRANGDIFEARVLVGSDGANGVVARNAGLAPVTEPPVAFEAKYPYDEAPPEWRDLLALELGSMAGGYGWSFPKSDHFNVGCGGWRDQGPQLRRHLSALRSRYGLDAVESSESRGHSLPTRDGEAPIVRGRALLVGDAAGLVDPMSGEGIYAAFVSGRLAASSVMSLLQGKSPDLWPYEAAVERELMPDIRAGTLLRDAYHFTPRPCYAVMRRSKALRRALGELITGDKTYEGLLRQLGPLQPLLRFWAARGRAARAATS